MKGVVGSVHLKPSPSLISPPDLKFPDTYNYTKPHTQSSSIAFGSNDSSSSKTCITQTGSNSYNLGPVPSKSEAESAISSLLLFVREISSPGLYSNWFRQILGPHDFDTLLSHGRKRAFKAFNLLQAEPSIKRLVVSLATDKSVWCAILSNEEVQKLLKPFQGVHTIEIQHRSRISNGEAEAEPEVALITSILRWISGIARAKISELILKFQSMVDQAFSSLDKGEFAEATDTGTNDNVKLSFLLTVMIILIVVVTRVAVS